MRLDEFYGHVGPFLLGQRSHEETVRLLYGSRSELSPQQAQDAKRLEIYGQFCQIHRQESLELVFQYCHQAVEAHSGLDAWRKLVEAYFICHPMSHFELAQNGRHFPTFLAEHCEDAGLPGFLRELADFEWWEFQTNGQPDDPADATPAAGPLRLHSTVELRPYSHALVSWIDDDRRQSEAPAAGENLVIFWRAPAPELMPRREVATPLEVMIIKAVVEEVPLDLVLAAQLRVSLGELTETVADLLEAGILIGEL